MNIKVDPGTPRRVRTGPEGARFLIVGGVPGKPYAPQANSALGGPETMDDPTALRISSRTARRHG